jgi:hypothetical protein
MQKNEGEKERIKNLRIIERKGKKANEGKR